jgi:hypothetical protein
VELLLLPGEHQTGIQELYVRQSFFCSIEATAVHYLPLHLPDCSAGGGKNMAAM